MAETEQASVHSILAMHLMEMRLLSVAAVLYVLALTALPADAKFNVPLKQDRTLSAGGRPSPWFCYDLKCPAFNRTIVKEGWEELDYETGDRHLDTTRTWQRSRRAFRVFGIG